MSKSSILINEINKIKYKLTYLYKSGSTSKGSTVMHFTIYCQLSPRRPDVPTNSFAQKCEKQFATTIGAKKRLAPILE